MNFLKTYQTLIITVVVAATFLYGYSRLISYLEANAKLAATEAQIALESQRQQNRQLAEQTERTIERYEAIVETLTAQNNALVRAQNQRAIAVQNQQQVDRTLPPDQLATRWATLVQQPKETIVPNDTGYQVLPTTAVETVVLLEVIPQLTEDLKDERQISENKTIQINEQEKVVDALNAQLEGLSNEIIAANTACKTEVALVKAEARKSKMRWFFIGGIVGAVVRGIVGI